MIHLVRGSLFSLIRKTMGKFIRPELMTVSDDELVQIDFENPENQLTQNQLFIGFTTRQVLNRLATDTIEQRQINVFYAGVRYFYIAATSYMIKHFPLKHEGLHHASFCNFELRMQAEISSIDSSLRGILCFLKA